MKGILGKRKITFAAAMAIVLATSGSASAVDIYYKNEPVRTDVAPVIEKGRTLVPIAVITESMGAKTKWDAKTKKVEILKDNITLHLWLGRDDYGVENKETGGFTALMDVPAKSINGRTMVPLGVIADAFGSKVVWDAKTQSVLIDSDISVLTRQEKNEQSKIVARIRKAFKDTPGREWYDLSRTEIRPYDLDDSMYTVEIKNEMRERLGPGTYQAYEADVQKRKFIFFVNKDNGRIYEWRNGVYALPDSAIVIPPNFGDKYAVNELIEEMMLNRKVITTREKLEVKIKRKDHTEDIVHAWSVTVYQAKPEQGKKKIAEYEVHVHDRRVIDVISGEVVYDDSAVAKYPEKMIGSKDEAVETAMKLLRKVGRIDPKGKYHVTDVSLYESAEVDGRAGYLVTLRQDSPDPNVTNMVGSFFVNTTSTVLMEYDIVNDNFIYLYGRYTPMG